MHGLAGMPEAFTDAMYYVPISQTKSPIYVHIQDLLLQAVCKVGDRGLEALLLDGAC